MEYIGYLLSAFLVLAVVTPLILQVHNKINRVVKSQAIEQERMQVLTRQAENLLQENAALLAKQDLMVQTLEAVRRALNENLGSLRDSTAKQLTDMRETLTQNIQQMQDGNNRQLENIRKTVDEKLQDNLDKKLSDSFQQVSQRLEQVYKGLGEMQQLANGVGDLKKVLSNVKTRGILGEIQLGGYKTDTSDGLAFTWIG